MADQVTRSRTQLQHARELRQERATEFWQRVINEGRIQRQAGEQTKAGETPIQKPRRPRQPRSS
jgi:hypothetical protein